ncbi:MAG: biopolymer transporter ExbD [candidate division Zixibacteria bacterium]|nr:biopolymer transporter ExbD [candidate division Zixibacteria bacterium]
MSGAVAERSKPVKKGLRRPKRRLSIVIDMTPMVDIAFLLLIFYMVTTVFSQPQAMEFNLPDPDEAENEIEVKASNLLTLWVDNTNEVFWMIGMPNADTLPVFLPGDPNADDSLGYVIHGLGLLQMLAEENNANNRLNTLILINEDARFSAMVEILDNIDLLERQWNNAKALKLKKKVSELTKEDGRFSYRYAVGKWEDRDTRIIETARAMAQETAQEMAPDAATDETEG